MPGKDGVALPQAGIHVATGQRDEKESRALAELGLGAVLDKPFTKETLLTALKSVLEWNRPPVRDRRRASEHPGAVEPQQPVENAAWLPAASRCQRFAKAHREEIPHRFI